VRLACGDSHSLTVDRDGRLFCWGANSCGQLGITNPDDPRIRKDPDGIPHLPTPALLEALADQRIVDIACGEAHSLAVSASGNLYSWGACSCGQLGLGSCDGMPVDSDGYPYQPTPTLVTAGFQGKAVLRVACGGVHNLAVTEPDQSLSSSLATLVNNDMLADVCFRSSEGHTLNAHMCVLKTNAPRLYHMVQTQIEERCAPGPPTITLEGGREVPVIDMGNVRMEVLVDFINFVYTLDADAAAMALSSFAAVLELYHLGSKFQVHALLPKCRRICRQQLGKQSIHRPWSPNFSSPTPGPAAGIQGGLDASDPPPADDVPAPLDHADWPGNDGWGVFFLPAGQALVLDGAAYRETLRRGTFLDLSDADAPATGESSTALEEHMRALLADDNGADVQLVVRRDGRGEIEYPAHKAVLASRSAYFRALFLSEFRERSQSRLPLEDITPEQLVALLNFIYADDWMVEDQEFALEMIPIADRFSVLDLKRLCERTLICTMSVDNVARIFALADRYACNRLRSRALLFMTDSNHFHTVMKTESFGDLDKVLILEILHSHKTTPAPAILPSEPLPGNSATASKAGQSKSGNHHRHARGGGSAGGAGTARPVSAAAAVAANGEHSRSSTTPSNSAGAAPPAAPVVQSPTPAAPDGPLPSNAITTTACASASPVAAPPPPPHISEPPDDVALSSSRSSTADEPPPLDVTAAASANCG